MVKVTYSLTYCLESEKLIPCPGMVRTISVEIKSMLIAESVNSISLLEAAIYRRRKVCRPASKYATAG